MPFEIDWEKGCVIMRPTGHFTAADLRQLNEAVFGDARSDDIRAMVCDLRGITSFELDESDMLYGAVMDYGGSRYLKKLRSAIVNDSPALEPLVNRFLGAAKGLQTPWEYAKFTTMEEARTWIEQTR